MNKLTMTVKPHSKTIRVGDDRFLRLTAEQYADVWRQFAAVQRSQPRPPS